MRVVQNFVLAALLRVQRFLIEYAAQLAGVVDLTVASKRLDDVIASFTEHAVNQDATSRSAKVETEKQHQLRLKLRSEQMSPIAEIARRNLRSVPEFKALQVPRRSIKGAAFFASATAMLDAATVHKDALTERGMPADFLDKFQDLLTRLRDSATERDNNHVQRKGATKGLQFQEQEGRSALKVLDALVRRALAGNASLLATWEGARTIQQRVTGTSAAATPPAQSTTTTPAAAPVTAPAAPPTSAAA